jgi:dephospho-CoA kinase
MQPIAQGQTNINNFNINQFPIRRLAITGGIACGKSVVAGIMSQRGIAICDSDLLAHEIIKKGTDVYSRILMAFGNGVLGPDAEIDRKVLGSLVFGDEGKLKLLNSIVHPAVKAMWCRWLDGCGAENKIAAVVVPLLFEAGFEKGWDDIICVASFMDIQTGRLMARGFSKEEAHARIYSQMRMDDKCIRSDYVIMNNFDLRLLGMQVNRIMDMILGEKI